MYDSYVALVASRGHIEMCFGGTCKDAIIKDTIIVEMRPQC